MAIINKSQTDKQNKDYWRTSPELINDAQMLLKIRWFSVDVCAKDRDTSIGLSTAYIDENINALSPLVDWNKHCLVKSEEYHCKYLPMFCNPPFSEKWQFFSKAIEQSRRHHLSILMVFPYTHATKQWHRNIHGKDCIIYVPDGRYQYLLPDGTKPTKNRCNFETCLILIVPFKCGNVIVDYKRGLNG